jgi:hypothetical protein
MRRSVAAKTNIFEDFFRRFSLLPDKEDLCREEGLPGQS